MIFRQGKETNLALDEVAQDTQVYQCLVGVYAQWHLIRTGSTWLTDMEFLNPTHSQGIDPWSDKGLNINPWGGILRLLNGFVKFLDSYKDSWIRKLRLHYDDNHHGESYVPQWIDVESSVTPWIDAVTVRRIQQLHIAVLTVLIRCH
ncbi:unnamed protein product [Microthlaspi erraticum]|uniref:Uncharacterized protein n=1 Tax=Microthlaspi erraticum TaxID=1685480 RepID=A0A6D2JTP3_9BRAS|nr:unnamed protein product [Microthlaspi erraticum]